MKTIRKKLLFTGIGFILLMILMITGAFIWLYTHSPDIDSTFHCEYLQEKVRVIRDKWGVPHIEARNGKDAYFAYGFTLAQDRLFQMEMERRAARGELAEIIGPSLLEEDKINRLLLFRHTAEEYLTKNEKKIDPQALKLLDAFLAGVNYFIETQPLPPEFTLLGITPRKFTRLDSLSMSNYMGYLLSFGIETDSLFSIIKTKFPDLDVKALFPDEYLEYPVTVMETQADFRGSGAEIRDSKLAGICQSPRALRGAG